MVAQHREVSDALMAALSDAQGTVYADAEWCALVARIHELRAEEGRLRWAIFKALGYNLRVLRRLTRGYLRIQSPKS